MDQKELEEALSKAREMHSFIASLMSPAPRIGPRPVKIAVHCLVLYEDGTHFEITSGGFPEKSSRDIIKEVFQTCGPLRLDAITRGVQADVEATRRDLAQLQSRREEDAG